MWIWMLTAAWAQIAFPLCTVPAFLGRVSDLVKWGFFVWMASLAHIPCNCFFPIFRYASWTNSIFVERSQYLLWPQVGDALHLALVLLWRPGWKWQGAMAKAAVSMNAFPSACLFWWVHVVPLGQVWCWGCWGRKAATSQGNVEKEGGVQRTLP